MAKKLYAVTSGGYEDYHIITLTESRKRAEKIAEMYDADVEEYEDNEELTAKPPTYTVYAYGGADCCDQHLDNVEKNVILGHWHGFAYVDAWSKQDAERKADVVFKEVREKWKLNARRKKKHTGVLLHGLPNAKTEKSTSFQKIAKQMQVESCLDAGRLSRLLQ